MARKTSGSECLPLASVINGSTSASTGPMYRSCRNYRAVIHVPASWSHRICIPDESSRRFGVRALYERLEHAADVELSVSDVSQRHLGVAK